MKSRHALTPGPDVGDEVARQRRKRADALLDRVVAGFDDVTLRQVVVSVLAATEESRGPLDVERFLSERGHAWQTVEMVLASLEAFDRHPSSPSGGRHLATESAHPLRDGVFLGAAGSRDEKGP